VRRPLFVLCFLVSLSAAVAALAGDCFIVRPPETPAASPAPDRILPAINAALDRAAPGDEIDVKAGKYEEDIVITRCVVVGPLGQGCTLRFNRLVIGALGNGDPESGVALEVARADTGGMQIIENQVYNAGGKDPDVDPRGLKHNWKPLDRARTGILIRGTYSGRGGPLRIHHNRVSGYHVGLRLEAEDNAAPLNAVIWKNRVIGNTTGMEVLAAGCTISENEILRNTGVGLVSSGTDNLISGNRIMDSVGWGLDVLQVTVRNNVIARNRAGGLRAQAACTLVHNTFVGNGGPLLSADDSAAVDFRNNLVDHAGALFGGPGKLSRSHNVYANGSAPADSEPGSRSGSLEYRNLPASDFRPQPESIAVDAGAPSAEVKRDADNAGRPIGSAPDAGAFEVGPAQGGGREWWVAPTGSDARGDGSPHKPFRTVTRASRDAGPDDLIYLKPGVYKGDSVETDPDAYRARSSSALTGSQTITCAGAEGHPIRILPAPGVDSARDLVQVFEARKPLEMAEPGQGKVVIQGGSWILFNCAHVVIQGIEFRESPHNVIHLGERASHIVIRDCVFINCPTKTPQGRSWHAGITGSGPEANDILIENNIFDRRPNTDYHHQECDVINPFEGAWSKRWVIRGNKIAGYEKLQLGSGGRPDYSTLGSPPTYHLVERNEIFECNRGVHIKSSDNLFRNNTIHDLVSGYVREWVGLMNRSGNRNVYDGNLVMDCPYAGILVLDKDNTVVNNVFVRCDTGVLVAYREFGATPAENTRVFHNTIVDSARAVQVEPRCSAMVYNNIIYNSLDFQKRPPTAPAIMGEGSGVFPLEKLDWSLFQRFKYTEAGVVHAGFNLYCNTEPPYLRNYEGGHCDVYADPLFKDPAKGDYRLRRQSPARAAGRSLDVGHDFDGRPRPADTPDVGAFQSTDLAGSEGEDP